MDAPEPVENMPDLSSESDVDFDERGAVSTSHFYNHSLLSVA